MKRLTTLAMLVLSVAACNFGLSPPPTWTEEQQPPAPAAQPTSPPTAPSEVLAAPERAAILLAVDAAPSGETIRPLLGVNAGPIPSGRGPDNAELTEQYHTIGVTMIRTHDLGGPLDMAVMYPDQNADPLNPASYDFSASDQVFAAIPQGGFEPYLRLGDSWSVRGLTRRAPANPANWVRAAVEVVRRYDEISHQAGVPLRYVEIWNEPNHPQFWDSDPRAFYELFAKTAAALKAEFPHLMIGGPGLASAGSLTTEGDEYTQRFLDYLQQQGIPLDFLSWHVYSSDAATYVQLAAFYRQQLDAHGYTEAESHITEWNTAMQGEDESDAVRNTARGAALMTAAWIGLQEEGVAVSTYYRGNETGQHGNMGLFYADGRAKPMALAFSLWAQMAAHPQRLNVTLTGSDDPNRLWVLTGQNESGEIALLIVNPADSPTSWQATFVGHGLVEGATLYQVSDASDEVQTFTLAEPAAEIGAYTVQLMLAQKSPSDQPPVVSETAPSQPGEQQPPPTAAPRPTPAVTAPYLMAFLACDASVGDCHDPHHHLVYLAQSDDGLSWSLIPNWQPYQGSVPDVIRRGDTLYIYTPGRLARYHLGTNTLDPPISVDIPGLPADFVDPSLFVDEQGRLVLFFLYGQPGSDPAGCAPGETSCVRQIGSATEVDGSDGAAFTLDAGQRVSITVDPQSAIKTASDPDIFFDGERYVLYLSHGASTSVWVSDELRGAYAQAISLPQGLLTQDTGGVPAGYFDPLSGQYWTFAHVNRNGLLVIRRAVHADLSRQLSESDFVTVISGESLGLGTTYNVGSPGFAVNRVAWPSPGATLPSTAAPTASLTVPRPTPPPATATPAGEPSPTQTPAESLRPVRQIQITSDGIRGELAFADGKFFVVYRSKEAGPACYILKVYDANFEFTGRRQELICHDPTYGTLTDHRLIFVPEASAFFMSYERASKQEESETHALFLAKYDADFSQMGEVLVTTGIGPRFGDEFLDDPAPLYSNGFVHVITKLRQESSSSPAFKVYTFDADLQPVGEPFPLSTNLYHDVNLAKHLSAVNAGDSIYLVTILQPEGGELCRPVNPTTSDLVALKFAANWTYSDWHKVLTASEEFELSPLGFKYLEDKFYVTYVATDSPRCFGGHFASGSVYLRVYDADFNLLQEVEVLQQVGDELRGFHPAVEVTGDHVYVVYTTVEGGEADHVYVSEYRGTK